MTHAVSYYAVKPMVVNGELREAGDLVPEARDWPALTGYINDGKIAPVLVATLPKATREALAEWEAEMNPDAGADDSTPTADTPQEAAEADLKAEDEAPAQEAPVRTKRPYNRKPKAEVAA